MLQLTDLFHWPSLIPPSPGRYVLLVGGEARARLDLVATRTGPQDILIGHIWS